MGVWNAAVLIICYSVCPNSAGFSSLQTNQTYVAKWFALVRRNMPFRQRNAAVNLFKVCFSLFPFFLFFWKKEEKQSQNSYSRVALVSSQLSHITHRDQITIIIKEAFSPPPIYFPPQQKSFWFLFVNFSYNYMFSTCRPDVVEWKNRIYLIQLPILELWILLMK